VYLETGHSVILGVNPLVRSLDAVPITINAAYEYYPLRFLSVGAFAGIGAEVLTIRHYQTALDLLTNKLKRTAGAEGVFTAGVTLGTAVLERSIELKAHFSVDLMMERSRTIPQPSFQLAIRVYPGALYAYTQKKQIAEYKDQEPVTESRAVESEPQAEQEPAAPEPKAEPAIVETNLRAQFKSIYVYFEPESAALDVNAKGEIKKAAAILKENDDLFILFESSAAPFGSQSGRLQLEAARVKAVAEYLQQKGGITHDRIIYNEPKDKDYHKDNRSGEDEYYIQYRYVKIRFVRIEGNPDEGVNSWAP